MQTIRFISTKPFQIASEKVTCAFGVVTMVTAALSTASTSHHQSYRKRQIFDQTLLSFIYNFKKRNHVPVSDIYKPTIN